MPKNNCPVEATIGIIGGKWKPTILLQLKDGPRGFNELRRRIPKITQRMLTLQLRALERDKIIMRRIFDTVPPTVEYYSRVWTQLAQHLNAKMNSIDRKPVADFSNLVASLRMSFILQKKRSTMLRIA